MFKAVQKLARTLIVLTVLVFIVASAFLVWFGYGIHSTSRSLPASIAFWMPHSHSASSAQPNFLFDELKEKLSTYPIESLYFHVGPLSPSGQLASDLSIPTQELNTLPTTNYAWIGQIRSEIDLDNPQVRATIVSSSQWAIEQGFDGIHVDIEPVRESDTAFYQLLQELRAALPDSKISVAMDEWQPKWMSDWVANVFEVSIESYWTRDQVEAVTPYIDELVVMTYDTGFHDPELYEWWVEQQTIALSNMVPETVSVRIGIPSYEKGSNFDPNAENLSTGLAGFERGIQNVRSDLTKLAGLAIYAYWEMDNGEWETLNDL